MHADDRRLLNLLGLKPTGDLGPLTAYTSVRSKPVWFVKANPLNPPSPLQTQLRNLWRLYAMQWRALTPEERSNWRQACRRARLKLTGPALFFWFQRRQDRATIQTIERQTGLQLLN